jgi:DNA-directed RNA polymerase specialized sigma24 family protein
MSAENSVSQWLGQLKNGDPEAAQKLWERYFRRLVGLARGRLQGAARRAADEEDVALSAFASFCRGVERNCFPRLDDRDDLWRVLVVIASRKASNLRRHQGQLKRGGGLEPGDVAKVALEDIVSQEPTPEFAVEVAEEYRRLLGLLADPDLEAVAVCKMEGRTTAEVAERLSCSPRSVERKLELIRDIWQAENDE